MRILFCCFRTTNLTNIVSMPQDRHTCEPLKVKFKWTLRGKRPVEKTESSTTKYMKALKERNPDRFEKYKVADRERAKLKYKKIEELCRNKKDEMRRKWAEQKRRQRQAKKKDTEQRTKLKDMTKEEKRLYWTKIKRQQRKKKIKQGLKDEKVSRSSNQ